MSDVVVLWRTWSDTFTRDKRLALEKSIQTMLTDGQWAAKHEDRRLTYFWKRLGDHMNDTYSLSWNVAVCHEEFGGDIQTGLYYYRYYHDFVHFTVKYGLIEYHVKGAWYNGQSPATKRDFNKWVKGQLRKPKN